VLDDDLHQVAAEVDANVDVQVAPEGMQLSGVQPISRGPTDGHVVLSALYGDDHHLRIDDRQLATIALHDIHEGVRCVQPPGEDGVGADGLAHIRRSRIEPTGPRLPDPRLARPREGYGPGQGGDDADDVARLHTRRGRPMDELRGEGILASANGQVLALEVEGEAPCAEPELGIHKGQPLDGALGSILRGEDLLQEVHPTVEFLVARGQLVDVPIAMDDELVVSRPARLGSILEFIGSIILGPRGGGQQGEGQ